MRDSRRIASVERGAATAGNIHFAASRSTKISPSTIASAMPTRPASSVLLDDISAGNVAGEALRETSFDAAADCSGFCS